MMQTLKLLRMVCDRACISVGRVLTLPSASVAEAKFQVKRSIRAHVMHEAKKGRMVYRGTIASSASPSATSRSADADQEQLEPTQPLARTRHDGHFVSSCKSTVPRQVLIHSFDLPKKAVIDEFD